MKLVDSVHMYVRGITSFARVNCSRSRSHNELARMHFQYACSVYKSMPVKIIFDF